MWLQSCVKLNCPAEINSVNPLLNAAYNRHSKSNANMLCPLVFLLSFPTSRKSKKIKNGSCVEPSGSCNLLKHRKHPYFHIIFYIVLLITSCHCTLLYLLRHHQLFGCMNHLGFRAVADGNFFFFLHFSCINVWAKFRNMTIAGGWWSL